MNLISDRWIPVRRRSGDVEMIAPFEITSAADNPALAVASHRPDFSGALTEFLIGLLQTCCGPADDEEWMDLLVVPPCGDVLQRRMDGFRRGFELDGDGFLFMQERELSEDEELKPRSISQLLIDAPGDNAVKHGTDHFVKSNVAHKFCPVCTATALYTLQNYAPSGGAGHRTSIRGGGPMTTIMLGNTLWETVWLNILPNQLHFKVGFDHRLDGGISDILAWLAPPRVSGNGGVDTQPLDVHPLQQFWATPRRILLQPGTNGESIEMCTSCGTQTRMYFDGYVTKKNGTNYTGPWQHTLTPYRKDTKTEELISSKPGKGGITYRFWVGIAENNPETNTVPAACVHQYRHRRMKFGRELGLSRIHAFGYDMDNMKARAWCESVMPLFVPKSGQEENFEAVAVSMVLASVWAIDLTLKYVREIRANPAEVRLTFWNSTEKLFYDSLAQLVIVDDVWDGRIHLLEAWRTKLITECWRLFGQSAEAGDFLGVEPGRIARAANKLRGSLHGRKLYEILKLNPDTTT